MPAHAENPDGAREETLLHGTRALDLTDEKGHLCGKILGDLGADVIKVERPGGDPCRGTGPFHGEVEDPERSLSWFAFNTSKRGITLNLEAPEGCDLLRELARTADFVIESFPPGYLAGLGLGFPDLERIRPGIVMTSITPFGQTGPYAGYRATDLVGGSMGGLVRILGDLNRPPVRMSCTPQAYCQAGVHGALGTMVAHYHRELSGEGQHVDVSMQEAVSLSLMNTIEIFELMGVNLFGMGQFLIVPRPPPTGPLLLRFIFRCKDGHVVLYLIGGFAGAVQSSTALLQWANEEGMALELRGYDFSQFDGATIRQEEYDRLIEGVGRFLQTRTKQELFEQAVKRGIMLAPCATTEDILRNPQLAAREFWETVEHPELGASLPYPGAPLKLGEAPWRIGRRAPLIGEHNREIYEELGISPERMARLEAEQVI